MTKPTIFTQINEAYSSMTNPSDVLKEGQDFLGTVPAPIVGSDPRTRPLSQEDENIPDEQEDPTVHDDILSSFDSIFEKQFSQAQKNVLRNRLAGKSRAMIAKQFNTTTHAIYVIEKSIIELLQSALSKEFPHLNRITNPSLLGLNDTSRKARPARVSTIDLPE